MCSYVIVCVHLYFRWISHYQEGSVAIPLPGLIPLPLGACPESGSGFPKLIDVVLFCGQYAEMRACGIIHHQC